MKKSSLVLSLVLVVVLAVSMLAACSPAEEPMAEKPAAKEEAAEEPAAEEPAEEAVVIGKIPITLDHAVHGNDAKWGKQYAMEQYGAEYKILDPQGDLDTEIQHVDTFIADEVDGIILHPVVESGVNEAIMDARDAGIYVITYFMDATEAEVPFVKVDETEPAAKMGENMAKQWKELYPDKPVSVGFVDFLSVEYCIDNRTGPFYQGVRKVYPELPDYSIEDFHDAANRDDATAFWLGAEGDISKSEEIGLSVLQSSPDVNIIYGSNTPNVLGLLKAFEDNGRGLAVDGVPQTEIMAGTDGDQPELLKLCDPTSSLKYTMGMQPQTFAKAQVDLMMQVINGEVAPDEHSEVYSYDVYMDYYTMSMQEIEDWYNTQYYGSLDIAAELAK